MTVVFIDDVVSATKGTIISAYTYENQEKWKRKEERRRFVDINFPAHEIVATVIGIIIIAGDVDANIIKPATYTKVKPQ